MYAGKLVEQGGVDDVLSRPAHPYTRGLIESVPSSNVRGPSASEVRRARALRQSAFPYSQAHIEATLNDNAGTAAPLAVAVEGAEAVDLYFRRMAKVPLLTREGEVEIAKKIDVLLLNQEEASFLTKIGRAHV